MSIHQELQRKARWLPRSVGRSAVVRFARFVDRFPRRSSLQKNGLSIEEYLLPGRGQARVRVIAPSQPSAVPRPAVLWIHGGGYVIGRAALDDHIAMNFARKLNVVVVAADYRLAPEHPYPIPLQDCYAAYQWLHSEAGRLGLDVEQVVVAGQSAGGGLAAALVQLLHDRQDPQPVLQLLVYPMLDDRTCLRSLEQRDFRLWDQKSNRFGWRSYLGHEPGTNAVETYAVPARRGDLRGLPMTWIGVGTCDLFHDECVDYGRRLRASGVPTELCVVEGAFHGFELVVPEAGVSQGFVEAQVAAMRKVLCAPPQQTGSC